MPPVSLCRKMSSLVTSSVKNGVKLIGINRVEKKNCVNHETALRLIEEFEKFEEDESAKVAVLYGEGGTFCAGYDLSTVSSGTSLPSDDEFLSKYRYMGPTKMSLRKPLIAAIEGFAVAGGLELALMADLRVASQSSQMGVFCRRVGVPLIDGGTVRLPRIVGLGRALDLIMTGRPIEAQEALQWGLVNRVVPEGEALSYSVSLAESIISQPISCMLMDRQSTYFSLDNSFEDSMKKEFESVQVLPEAIKEAKKFMEKKVKPPSKL